MQKWLYFFTANQNLYNDKDIIVYGIFFKTKENRIFSMIIFHFFKPKISLRQTASNNYNIQFVRWKRIILPNLSVFEDFPFLFQCCCKTFTIRTWVKNNLLIYISLKNPRSRQTKNVSMFNNKIYVQANQRIIVFLNGYRLFNLIQENIKIIF